MFGCLSSTPNSAGNQSSESRNSNCSWQVGRKVRNVNLIGQRRRAAQTSEAAIAGSLDSVRSYALSIWWAVSDSNG
jgi:hypothetical protein